MWGHQGGGRTCYKETKKINELSAIQTCKSLTSPAPIWSHPDPCAFSEFAIGFKIFWEPVISLCDLWSVWKPRIILNEPLVSPLPFSWPSLMSLFDPSEGLSHLPSKFSLRNHFPDSSEHTDLFMTPSNYEWPLSEPIDLSMTPTNCDWPLSEPIALFMTQLHVLIWPFWGPKLPTFSMLTQKPLPWLSTLTYDPK